MTQKQPAALRLADRLETEKISSSLQESATDELRRLHEVNAALLDALKIHMAAYSAAWKPGMEIIEPIGDAAIAKAEGGAA